MLNKNTHGAKNGKANSEIATSNRNFDISSSGQELANYR